MILDIKVRGIRGIASPDPSFPLPFPFPLDILTQLIFFPT